MSRMVLRVFIHDNNWDWLDWDVLGGVTVIYLHTKHYYLSVNNSALVYKKIGQRTDSIRDN